MAKLISLSHSGKLDTGKKISTDEHKLTIPKATHRLEREEYESEGGGTWLQAGMPVLYGPHSDRPWVQILRALTHGDKRSVAYASHPELPPTKS